MQINSLVGVDIGNSQDPSVRVLPGKLAGGLERDDFQPRPGVIAVVQTLGADDRLATALRVFAGSRPISIVA